MPMNGSVEDMWQRALAAQMPGKVNKPTTSIHEQVVAERRRRNQVANKKYRHSEKGRIANARQCRRYFENHREQCQQYVVKYKKAFLEKFGVTFGSWDYWRRKLLAGRCQPADVPERYSAIMEEWLARRKQNEPEVIR